MKLGFDYSLWISPIDGKILSSSNLPGLRRYYGWEGNRFGEAEPSPILIDLKLDLINLRNRVSVDYLPKDLPRGELFIGNDNNVATNTLEIGLLNLPSLGGALFPVPGVLTLPSVLIPNPTFNPLSGFDWIMSGPWLPQVYVGDPGVIGTSRKTVISSSLAMTQVRASQIDKRLSLGTFIMKSRGINFIWENPAMYLVPQVIRDLYGLSSSYTFDNVQALDELGDGIVYTNGGVLSVANLTTGRFWLGQDIGERVNVVTEVEFLPIGNLPGLGHGNVWIGNDQGRPVEGVLAPSDATYVIRTANGALPNAQALRPLGAGLTKLDLLGNFEIAIPNLGGDYVTPGYLTERLLEYVSLEEFPELFTANFAIEFPEAFTAAFTAEITLALSKYTVTVLTPAIFTRESKVDHNADMKTVNDRIDLIEHRVVKGTDNEISVDNQIDRVVISLVDNPTLPGKGYVIIPGGLEEEKPIATDCKLGMFRYTT